MLGGGLRPGELTFIAGRPGMGKTTLCWSMAHRMKQSGNDVRVIIEKQGYTWTGNPFGIDTYTLTPMDEIETLAHIKTSTNEKYDVLLYTALYSANNKEVENVYGDLKRLAVEYGIAIVVEAGVDRSVERTDTHRPSIEHLKYRKAIEQHADNILFVFNNGYYNASVDSSAFEVIVAKSTSGQSGSALLRFEIAEIPVTLKVPVITERGTNFVFLRLCSGCGENFDRLQFMPDGRDYCSQECFDKYNQACRDCGAIVPFGEGVAYNLPYDKYVLCYKCL